MPPERIYLRKNIIEKIAKCIKQFAQIADKLAKSHSGQMEKSRFIAVIVSKETAPQEVKKGEGWVCIKQPVRIVEELAKSLLGQMEKSRFIAVIVSKEIAPQGIEPREMKKEEGPICIKQLAQTADKLAKSLLGQVEKSRFIAVTALVKETIEKETIRNMMKLMQNWIRLYFSYSALIL